MSDFMDRTRDDVLKLQDDLVLGLKETVVPDGENLLSIYEKWKELHNDYDGLLTISDPFNVKCAGDFHAFDRNNSDHMLDLNIICISIFLSQELRKVEQDAVSNVFSAKTKEQKINIIDNFISFINNILDNPHLSWGTVALHDFAEKQIALHGRKRNVDFYQEFFSYRETLRMETVGSIYLLFTKWRISRTKSALKKLVSSIIGYIQTYYADYDNDPDMHLYDSLDGLMIINKLKKIIHWLELIAYHTEGIFDKYRELKWLGSSDILIDDWVVTNQISRLEMLHYRQVFLSDSNDVVKKKAVCNHGYGIWIKTSDIMWIVTDIFRIISSSDEESKRLNGSTQEFFEYYDFMLKIRNHYIGEIFSHTAFFEKQRGSIDSQIMEALEEDAEEFTGSIDDVIQFSEAIASDDIEALLQAKKNYVQRLSEYMSPVQEKKLDELTDIITKKIKEQIQKLDVYNQLYASVADEFKSYAQELVRYPQILASLVSAEYLYGQYVDKKPENVKFDYSCISIMYYMALEDFANKLVYTPYSDEVLSTVSRGDFEKYVTGNNFWDKKHKRYKKTCEIGTLGHMFSQGMGKKPFYDFIVKTFPGIDETAFRSFGEKLIKIAPRRNEAAHGGNLLNYETVCSDKREVFNADINQYRGMILELLNTLFDRV